MKTSEFIEKVEALDFVERVTEGKTFRGIYLEKNLFVQDEDNRVLARVSVENDCSISTSYEVFENLEFKKRKRLFNLATQYAETPIAERRDKTIEEKAREYMKECMSDNLNFYSCVDNLEFNKSEMRESEIYEYYCNHSNKFVKMWCEVSVDE